jgi:hypothetical protein
MSKRFYLVTRDLHLYFGLFISPFILIFAVSTLFLVHPWTPAALASPSRTIHDPSMPANLETLGGRDQVNAIHDVLDRLGIRGEAGFVRRVPKQHRLILPLLVPGRETVVDLNVETRSVSVSEHITGTADALVYLHRMPGQHNQNIRGNSPFMRLWRWFADAVVYLVMFISASGVYLWTVLRAERRVGIVLLAAGAFSFFGIVYAISH